MEQDKCKECEKKWSCKYLKYRFGVNECAIGKKIFVDRIYERELKEREEMLKVTNNYGRNI